MAGVAQLAEHRIVIPGVVGSTPIARPSQAIHQGAGQDTIGRSRPPRYLASVTRVCSSAG